MTYQNNQELPSAIQTLPYQAQTIFRQSFNTSNNRYDSNIANKVAWEAVKSRFVRVGTEYVAKGLAKELLSFKMDMTQEVFITKADNGDHFLEAVLSDDMKDSQGKRFTTKALKSYADQINTHGISGFITHADWDSFKMKWSHLSPEAFVAKARSERKGILKTIKAVFEKGKLWIKAIIDKRYLKQVKKFNRLSIEAYVPSKNQVGDTYDGGYALGFAMDNNAINRRAIVANIN